MAAITMSQVTRLDDPHFQRIAERIALAAQLAAEKVAASYAEPERYPLTSDEGSIEQILKSRFNVLPESVQQAAAARAIARISAPAAERAERYGDLANVDLTVATAIDVQMQALSFPAYLRLPSDHPVLVLQQMGPETARPMPLSHQTSSKLEFRIHKVKCLDETDGLLGSEAGDDEIYLGGTTMDENGDAEKIDAFLVRDDFDDGEEHIYSPPKQFAAFDLTEGTDFPKSYFVTLVLFEVDNGAMHEVLHKLLMWVKEKVTTALSTAIGSAIGGIGGPIGALIGAAVGAAVGLIVDFIKDIWEDDPFKPGTLRIDIPSYAHRFENDAMDSPEGKIIFQGHGGEYELTFDWRLFGPPIQPPVEPGEQNLLGQRGVIYAVELLSASTATGRIIGRSLLWYPYRRSELGSLIWGPNAGASVGRRFPSASKVFSGRDGVIYEIIGNGELVWHRHSGWRDGSANWSANSGNTVSNGWGQYKQVFSGGDGVIYAVQQNGDLLWYRHDGWRDGSVTWAAGSGSKVGNGWDFKQVFSGGGGIIYAVQHSRLDPATGRRTGRHLLWYRHDGWQDGSNTWAANSSATVGRYWEHFSEVFSGDRGFVFAVQKNGDLLWYQHDGRHDGSFIWAEGSGKKVGNGWNFSYVFSG